jgi:putative FmdB family regulatory protein
MVMPTYEYSCRKCGVVETFQRMSEEPLTSCPECGSKGVKRLLSGGAGVIFKGEGFWETDYNRSSDYKSKASAEAGSGSAAKESSPATTGTASTCTAKAG